MLSERGSGGDQSELKAYDVLTLGNTELMLIPLCGEKFSWDDVSEKNGVNR